MTFAQKMLDERRIGYADGLEEGIEQGRKQGLEQGLKSAVQALRGILAPEVIAERFHISLNQVLDILGQE